MNEKAVDRVSVDFIMFLVTLLDDPTWAENVVRTLAKRLGKAKYLDELAKAIINEDRHTDCCVVPTSPHELNAVDNCRYPFAKKTDMVCINPFHYEPIHAKATRTFYIHIDMHTLESLPIVT
uniref:MH1 domain-containing protein n=1 Tax=Angiostrongylus cantonensis TaxID=6313 RepID=A0A0K0CU93_ANGCA